MKLRQIHILAVATFATVFVAGCGFSILAIIPDSDEVRVRVINNTDFDVDPGVEFGMSENALELFDSGIMASGEIITADIFCDDIIVLTATEPAQLGFSSDFVLDSLPFFEIDFDYLCGDLVEFEFAGNGQDFDVFVDVNGENLF